MEHEERLREARHLADTIAVAQGQLDKAAREDARQAQAIRELQEERMEARRMDMGGMDSDQGFADLLALSQDTLSLTRMTGERAQGAQKIRTLLRMKDSPYFARIDFCPDGGTARQVYIGRATLMEEDTMRIHVYDWRVPIAGLFYQYGVGPARYEAPGGTISGELRLKRQYEIRRGELVYYFDADEQIVDGFLRELLARPAAPAMKSIVETIQRDQDRIIRDMQADLLMVQGAAGSGKTSVALHRIAYLMYQGLQKGRLAPEDIMILAPNATFERYIAHVLPDLGEAQVQTLLLEDLLGGLMPGARVEPRSAWVERLLTQPDPREAATMRQSRGIKGSAQFVALLNRLLHELPRRWIPFADVDYAGQRVATAQLLRTEICNSTKVAPLGIQLRMQARAIWRRIHALRPARYKRLMAFADRYVHHAMEVPAYARMLSIRESGRLLAHIQAFSQIDCAALYRRLFESRDAFHRLAEGLLPPDQIEPLRQYTLAGLHGDTLPYEDAAAIAYLRARVEGCRAYTHLRQVVVDEAQDLDALHATLLGMLFPQARFTILGDVHQTLSGTVDMSLYDAIAAALRKPGALLARLEKSFRCTREIWAFSARFLPPGEAGTCFSRSGEAVGLHRAQSRQALDAMLLENARACRQAGYGTVALLCKTQADAQALHGRLAKEADVRLIGPDDGLQGGGIYVLSLYMAKGLEFDAVLLCDVDSMHYQGEADKALLYIGCTRALHVLRLFYTGDRSPLIEEAST